MKIPYPGDLNAIETAVWAAEFVRARAAAPTTISLDSREYVRYAVDLANGAVEELRAQRSFR